jgi:type VI secretion system protein ImpH
VDILPDQLNRLGLGNSQLGENLVLGEHVRDRGGKFRIHIRQLSWERFHDFLPTGSAYQPLCALVRFILRDPLDYDITLELQRDDHPARQLRLAADSQCSLGWTSWLGHAQTSAVVTLRSAPPVH